MRDTLFFWLVVESVGLAGLPAAVALFRRVPGGGLAFARPIGMLLAAYPAWLLAGSHIVPYSRWTAAAGLVAVGGGAGAATLVAVRRQGRGVVREALRSIPVRLWAVSEGLFVAGFFGWALVRAYSPDVWNTEKPMDMAFVNAINRSDWLPPHDPWLAGAQLNYYYYGHYLVAWVIRVASTGPTEGFNLGLALVFALTLSTVFGAGSALWLAAARPDATRPPGAARPSATTVGLVSAAVVVLLGNLEGGFAYLHHPGRLLGYDWWSPSRVIPGSANEFPMFSFLLGDLHAHVLALPFLALAITFALQLALAGPPTWRRPGGALEIVLAALVLGALYPLNSLDFPIEGAVVLLALALWASAGRGRFTAVGAFFACLALLCVTAYLPFWLGFDPAVHGLAIVGDHANFTSFARDQLLIYGLSLWLVAVPLLRRAVRVPFRFLVWGTVAATFVLVLLAPGRLAGLALLLTVAAATFYVAFDTRQPQPYRFAWLLAACGLGALALAELVYLRDFFAGTEDYRFNTIFKLGFHAWLLLGLGAVFLSFWTEPRLTRRLRLAWRSGVIALVGLSLAYPIAGSYSRSEGFAATPTLDGLRWLAQRNPGDVGAIEWLRGRPGNPTVLETTGGDFDFDGRGRISVYTGLPTVIQWPGHELQWGHSAGRRLQDVRAIYSTTNRSLARRLLDRYHVRYVVVGRLEREDYPRRGLAKFPRLGRRVFSAGGTAVFQTGTG